MTKVNVEQKLLFSTSDGEIKITINWRVSIRLKALTGARWRRTLWVTWLNESPVLL